MDKSPLKLHKPKGIGGHQLPNEGRTNDWITPRKFIQALGPFDLDPCASDTQPWPCAQHSFTQADDGLSKEWRGLVWLNPPYGPYVGDWLDKLSRHGNGIAMIFARTDTIHFHVWVFEKAAAVLFLEGRPYFCRPNGDEAPANCGGPICLVAYGPIAFGRLQICQLKGFFIDLDKKATQTRSRSRPPEIESGATHA